MYTLFCKVERRDVVFAVVSKTAVSGGAAVVGFSSLWPVLSKGWPWVADFFHAWTAAIVDTLQIKVSMSKTHDLKNHLLTAVDTK